MLKNPHLLFLSVLYLLPIVLFSQEIKIFKVEDFDLKGNVKSSLVSTSYGKEEYVFNKEGFLTKSVTHYSDLDYDITYYKYSKGMLLEKRFENYRDNNFDKSTSIASFYTIDSLLNLKITEKIVSYSKEFLDQYEYYFVSDTLFKIVHTNDSGIDETLVTYTDVKGERTKSYVLNGVIQKSIRTSVQKEKDSVIKKNVLTKKFLGGITNSALEEIFDGKNKLISETKFYANQQTNKLAEEESNVYSYEEKGVLSQKVINTGNISETNEYIYQFDENGNWIKEIITPDNTYKTRKISYFQLSENKKQ